MRAAKNFSHGRGEHRDDGQPIKYNFQAGDEIPDEIAEELDDSFILERVAEDNPDELTRDQLMVLAGIGVEAVEGSDDGEVVMEYDEGELRDALGNFGSKGDIVEWFETVHPGSDLLDPSDQTRTQMVDLIVEELTGE